MEEDKVTEAIDCQIAAIDAITESMDKTEQALIKIFSDVK